MSLLKSFTKDVPQRCSFLPSTMENTNTTARTNSEQSEGGGDKRTEGHVTEGLESEDEAKESRDLLHQHIPHNHVSKVRIMGSSLRTAKLMDLGSLPYLCIKNETMAPLHVATLTVQRELPIIFCCTKNETMAPLHVTTLTFKREL